MNRGETLPGKEMVQTQIEQWMAGCECSAHQSNLEWAFRLIEIPQPVTDDRLGVKVGKCVTPCYIQGKWAVRIRGGGGSIYAMNYVLQLPSGRRGEFTGWPDFTETKRLTPLAERRILNLYSSRCERLHAVGETQSTQGNTDRALAITSRNDVTFTSVWQKLRVELHSRMVQPVTTTNPTPN